MESLKPRITHAIEAADDILKEEPAPKIKIPKIKVKEVPDEIPVLAKKALKVHFSCEDTPKGCAKDEIPQLARKALTKHFDSSESAPTGGDDISTLARKALNNVDGGNQAAPQVQGSAEDVDEIASLAKKALAKEATQKGFSGPTGGDDISTLAKNALKNVVQKPTVDEITQRALENPLKVLATDKSIDEDQEEEAAAERNAQKNCQKSLSKETKAATKRRVLDKVGDAETKAIDKEIASKEIIKDTEEKLVAKVELKKETNALEAVKVDNRSFMEKEYNRYELKLMKNDDKEERKVEELNKIVEKKEEDAKKVVEK